MKNNKKKKTPFSFLKSRSYAYTVIKQYFSKCSTASVITYFVVRMKYYDMNLKTNYRLHIIKYRRRNVCKEFIITTNCGTLEQSIPSILLLFEDGDNYVDFTQWDSHMGKVTRIRNNYIKYCYIYD